jgi:predicted cupin superfamily sugar epimerase
LHPDGTGKIITLGQDIQQGMRLRHVVPGGVWQGSRIAPGGAWALLGTTMAPGFDFDDYTGGNRMDLAMRYPDFSDWVTALTHTD